MNDPLAGSTGAYLAANWGSLHFTLVFGLLGGLMLLEAARPRTALRHPLRPRWLANGLVLLVDQLLLRLLVPLGAALLASQWQPGLPRLASLPAPLAILLTIVALDLTLFACHRLAHQWPILWRIHRLHHSDPDVDVTTGWRFHPLEALLHAGSVTAMIVLLGSPPLGVGLYLLLQTTISMLSHANVRLPARLDRVLRYIVITPDMHRIHHSVLAADHHSNFAIGLSLWDRLLGSYREQPLAGHAATRFGLDGLPPERAVSIAAMLADPFTRDTGGGPQGPRGKPRRPIGETR